MSQVEDTSGFRIRGWHVFAGVAAFFAVIIAVNTVFIVAALRTYPGEVSVTPYEDGLAHNRRLAQQAAQAELGWRAAAAAQPQGVEVHFIDREGHPLAGLSLTAHLQRPATEAGARSPEFVETAPGVYLARLDGMSGAWDLTLKAVAQGGEAFEAERRLTWP